jgi:hypothetical protein
MNKESRLYSFVNFYLSSIQQGIQTGHLADSMSVKYLVSAVSVTVKAEYVNWIKKHKTYIVLNGGDDAELRRIFDTLWDICAKLKLPFDKFQEPGLSNIMTCCGVVLPEQYFKVKKNLASIDTGGSVDMGWVYEDADGKKTIYQHGSLESKLIELIKSKPLAR